MNDKPQEQATLGEPFRQPPSDNGGDKVVFDIVTRAIVKGEIGLLKQYLSSQPQLAISQQGDGVTLLHIAASGVGNLEAAQLLIEHGADVNVTTADLGKTPLILASEHDAMLCELLLKNGANPNSCTKTGHSALHFASSNCIIAAVEFILAYGGDVNMVDADGTSALHLAAYHGHYDVVRLLLGKGADPNRKDDLGTPLYHAIAQSHPDVVQLLQAVTRSERG